MDENSQRLELAYAQYKSGKIDEAEALNNQILQASPFNAKALQLSSMIASDKGEYKTALDRIMTALTRSPDDPELLNVMAGIQSSIHDPMRAELALRMALKRDPVYADARHNLALLLLEQNMPHLAIEHLDKLISSRTEHLRYKLAKISALIKMGSAEDAEAILNNIDEKRIETSELALLRCQMAFVKKDHSSLIENAYLAQTDDKNGSRAIGLVTQALVRKDAIPELEQFLSSIKKNLVGSAGWAHVARAYRLIGDLSTSVKVLSEGFKHFPKHPELLVERADTRIELRQPKEAFEAASAALKKSPGDLPVMSVFARSAIASGEARYAQIAADGALKRHPNNQFWWAVRATGGRMSGQNYKYYYDYETLVREYILPVPKGFETLADFNAAVKNILDKLHEKSGYALGRNFEHGTQTDLDLRFVDDPVIQAYFEALDGPIRDYMNIIGNDPNHILSRRNSGHYRLSGAWSVKLKKDGFHVNHVHPQGWISSAYYVDVPDEIETSKDKEGWIGFGQPPADIADIEAPEHFVKPEAGKLVLFPSYMWHGTVPIKGNATRLTLPFDVVPAPPPIQ